MSNYYYSSDYMHCSQDRCPRHKKCWRYQLGIDIKTQESHIASYFKPSPDEDLSNCKRFIDKRQYKIKKPKENHYPRGC